MTHPNPRENRLTLRLLAISVIFLVVLVGLLAALLTIRHNDLAKLEKQAAARTAANIAEDQKHAQAFCDLLLTYKQVPPSSSVFVEEIVRRAADLAKKIECPGA